MADDEEQPPAKGGDKTFTQQDLERELDKRLKRERAKYADYDELKAKAEQFDKAGEQGKDTGEKLAQLQKDLDEERNKRLKAEVAASKGLTPAQAKRLSGTTQEELEADADDLLEAFPAPSNDEEGTKRPRPPSSRPKPDLRGGNEPGDDEPVETNPAKLAEGVPRF